MSDISKRLAALPPEKRALLAERLQKEAGLKPAPAETLIPKRAVRADGKYPLSSAQNRMWFLNQLHPNSPLYNEPLQMLRLRGALNTDALEQSVQALEARHEVLRTAFLSDEGTPYQVIHAPGRLLLSRLDLSGEEAAAREELLQQAAREEANKPFDLEQGQLIRLTLVKLQDEEHVLFSILHHIISDGASTGVLIGELVELYNAFSRQQAPQLSELPVQYADYGQWQLDRLESPSMQKQLDYWRGRLGGTLPVLELPHDRPRSAERSYKGKKKTERLSSALTDVLHAWSRQEGVTPFMTLLTAFNVLLSRYTGQEDVLVGTPITNRNRSELERMIGFFVNTLVLRTDVSGNPTFRELVGQVRDHALDAFANQEVPLEKLAEELLPDRGQGHNSLFNVMFAFQTVTPSSLELNGLETEWRVLSNESIRFDLLFSLTEGAHGISALLEYDTDLFSTEFVERMFRHFQTLLHAALTNPELRIQDLPLLDDSEREQLLALHGPARPDLQSVTPLHQLFEAQAARTPNAAAVVCEGESLTYGDLNARANVLARRLQQTGIGAETLVGICMERSVETVLAVLAVLKAGGAYLPIDPKVPLSRLNYLLSDAGASLLLVNAAVTVNTSEFPVATLTVAAADYASAEEADAANLNAAVGAENLAYLIYTSGSTGQPKGVCIEHRQIVHYALAIADRFGMAAGDAHAFAVTLAADAGNTVFFPSLLTGGTLHVLTEDRALDPQGMAEYFDAHGIDWIKIAPSHLIALHNEAGVERILPRKGLVLGGEASRFDWLRSLYQKADCAIYNHYGPTETTVGVLTYRLDKADLANNHALAPLSSPLPNTEAYVLDSSLQPVPVGVPGTLYIGGDGVSRGYLNRPELTAERFLAHPFGGQGRLYNTGDLVRRLADGKIEYLGRADDQVKIRGFRIELGEIEAELAQHPAVKEAALLTREVTPGDKRLYAYAALSDETVLKEELLDYLADRLPDYMVPSDLLIIDTLPRAGNGKVDRNRLSESQPAADPGAAFDEAEADKQTDIARTQIEEILEGIFCSVLNVPQFAPEDNFFKHGGHSLLATKVLSRIRKAFGVKLPLRALFDTPTLAGMAERVRLAARAGRGGELPPILPVAQDGLLPLSFAQQRLWFLHQLDPQSPFYNMPLTLRLDGPLQISFLAAGLAEVVKRHSSLRTVFPLIDGQPAQQILPAQDDVLDIVDLTALSQEEREAEALNRINEDCRRPFDLERGPLLYAALYRMSDTSHVLLLNMHHIVSDGWSNGILLRELKQLYSAFLRGQAPQLPDVLQYADFAVWQREYLAGELFEEQMNYWTKQLLDVPPMLMLPTDHPRPAVQSFRGKTKLAELDGELSARVNEFAREQGVTVYMLLLAAFQTMLYRFTGQEDLLIGSPIAGRNRAEVEEVIGFFINTLVMRGQANGDMTFEKLLKNTRDTTLNAFQHGDLPYEKLVEALQPERSLSYNPLVQVSFTLQNHHGSFSLPELAVSGYSTEWSTSKFDLSLIVIPRQDSFVTVIEYNTDLFEAQTIQRMLGNYEVLLRGILAAPQEILSKLPILTEAERHQQLVLWNQTEVPVPDRTVHGLFEENAARVPDNIAVIFAKKQLTYRQLNEQANRLARHLHAKGIRQGDAVGICLERSEEVVVSILAALKAGAFYVPLDPTQPAERLAFQVEDAGIKLVISQAWLQSELAVDADCVVCLQQEKAAIGAHAADNLNVPVSVEDPAYIMYTSGSTGQPKGVLIRHHGVINLSLAAIKRFDITEASRVGQFATINFDGSVYQMFTPLHAGAAVCVLTREEQLSVDAFAAMARETGITWMDAPPVLFDALHPDDVPTLRTIVCGGERMPVQVAQKWSQGRRFYNGFGPTEATVITSWHLVEDADRLQSVPIGRPIENMEMYILDAHRQPVPIGVPGELYIGGIGLAVCYWKREELTAETFIPHPFKAGQRLYKSGDLVRRLPNGDIEHVGRSDYQVKIRGVRIEPEEIERCLNADLQVAEAVVMTPEDDGGQKQIVAYVVPARQPLNIEELRSGLRSKLPDYMVPSFFVELAELPRNHNRKIDRSRLPALDSLTLDRETAYIAPSTPEEELLVALFAEVLQRDPQKIGIHDNFFRIGGHSLLATQLVAKIRSAFAVDLPLLAMFETPTAAGLLDAVLNSKLQAAGGLDSLFSELDSLTDEEVERMIAAGLAAENDNEEQGE